MILREGGISDFWRKIAEPKIIAVLSPPFPHLVHFLLWTTTAPDHIIVYMRIFPHSQSTPPHHAKKKEDRHSCLSRIHFRLSRVHPRLPRNVSKMRTDRNVCPPGTRNANQPANTPLSYRGVRTMCELENRNLVDQHAHLVKRIAGRAPLFSPILPSKTPAIFAGFAPNSHILQYMRLSPYSPPAPRCGLIYLPICADYYD